MLVAEDLLLLLTDDRSGKLLTPSLHADIALGGAVLIELALGGRVALAADDGRVHVTDSSDTGDEVLDDALVLLAAKEGATPKDVLRALGKGLRKRLDARLAERGVLHEEAGTILGIPAGRRWTASDSSHEDAVRVRLTEALRDCASGDEHVVALASLLHALGVVAKVVGADSGMTKQELNARAERLAEGSWGAHAVGEAIRAVLAAVIASTTSSIVAAGA